MYAFKQSTVDRPPLRRDLDLRPRLESLETRLALSTAAIPAHGVISGAVKNELNGLMLRNVEVDLINSAGRVAESTHTDASGKYRFDVPGDGAYVVHVVPPRGFIQGSPTFTNVKPTGALAPGAASSSWTYSGTNTNPAHGPVNPYAWDAIAPAGKLPFQSPINITTPAVDLQRVLSLDYNPAVPKQVVNDGHQFQAQFSTTSSHDTINVSGVPFTLAQFHYHSPSETLIHGRRYAMEEHFVNTSSTGAQTVLAVFLKVGAHNGALDPILSAAANLSHTNSTTPGTVPIDFAGLLPSNMQGWFYEGSLTTPPLTQPVNWFVFQTPITLDAQQFAKYTRIATAAGFDPNARPVQPLDGRRLNQIDYDVNFQTTSVSGLNFAILRKAV